MKKEGFYSSGEFAKKAHVTKKTIRYYDEHNILKPSFVSDSGARFYSDEDFARLQQILFLKYLGFSLADIKEMTVRNSDKHFFSESLHMQLGLIEEKIEQMQLIKTALVDASKAVKQEKNVDWSKMMQLVNVNEMEHKLKVQYQNSSNISARINLHEEFSKNKQGWFPWLFEQCELKSGENVLELGCGDASLWRMNREKIPEKINVILSDISDGMIRDVRRSMKDIENDFSFEVMDAHHINAPDESFDIVIANHVLFYCEDLEKVCSEIKRVLKPGGRFVGSTYGNAHMKEISMLVSDFDSRIVLSADRLYEKFGKQNGGKILEKFFSDVSWSEYEDYLEVTKPESLISYVLSCHGNQNRFIVDRYNDFVSFVKKKTKYGFDVTKEAGVFREKINLA
jgi:ubiquinone/menaquinone biosynthesis C-methylase UbiE